MQGDPITASQAGASKDSGSEGSESEDGKPKKKSKKAEPVKSKTTEARDFHAMFVDLSVSC